MVSNGFISIQQDPVMMWEMFLYCFVKIELFQHVTNVRDTKIAKGAMSGMIGNKGCVAQNFTLQDRHFNIIATHLRHGQNAVAERNQMARDLINELRLQHLQSSLIGLECDQSSDICIFMGDMNYRMNTRFQDFNNTNVFDEAVDMIPTHDQLVQSMSQGNYPEYQEAPITFFPSYKLMKSQLVYIDKKDQAPTYCDRVIYKNNTCLDIQVDEYSCHHEVYGSDHRPVSLAFTIKNFGHPQYYDIPSMLKPK